MIDQFLETWETQTRRVLIGAFFLSSLVAAGCSDSASEPTDDVDAGADAGFTTVDGGTVDGGAADAAVNEPCQPVLSAAQSTASVLPLDLFTVRAAGGTGAYRFTLVDNQSGAIINALSGAYLSGDAEGTIDTVEITDDGCIGSAQVEITVVNRIELRPSVATVPPSTSFQFQTLGGTGEFEYRLVRDGTGATLTVDGQYSAGSEGIDRIEVLDAATGEVAEATITVDANATMTADPPVMFVPVGESYLLRMRGGSGFVEVTESPAAFRLEDRQVIGVAAGRAQVTLRDQFTGQTAPLTVEVTPGFEFDRLRAGTALFANTILPIGDVNGDGFADLVIANPEAAVEADRGGAVYIYAGNAAGFDRRPAQIIGGRGRSDELGRAVAVADFDGDGQPDLAVGVPRSDVGGGDRGAVEIYQGLANGFFAPQPQVRLGGNFGGDLFGWALSTCDYNADGLVDLAVGAYNAEDRNRSPQSSNQGGVFVYLGHSDGFRDTPDQFLWGDEPDGNGGWRGDPNAHFGIALASGDHDGDGVCDLAAGTYLYDAPGGNDDGLLYVHRGIARTDADFGGLEPRPSRAWASLDVQGNRTSHFARNLAMGDVNGDGRDDLLVSQNRFDNGSSDNHGAVRLFLGAPMINGTVDALAAEAEASWTFAHGQSNDYVGFAVSIGEATGDDLPDILIGSYLDEVETGNQGTIRVFAGRRDALPADAETRVIAGLDREDRLGSAVAAVGDLDGDGRPEIVGLAAATDDYGLDVGTPTVISGDETLAPTILEYPGEGTGMRFGQGAAIVGDVTGDGFEDLVVSAPFAATEALGLFSGLAFLYRGTANGFETEPALVFEGMRRHSSFDYFGWSVAPAGDFDRDGVPDIAVISRFEDKATSTSYSADYLVDPGCPAGSQSNVGAVYVFRGSRSGLPDTQPAFMIYGPQPNDSLRQVRGGFDYNGDGFDDLAISSYEWDQPGAATTGGIGLIRGRSISLGAETAVFCGPDLLLLGNRANDQLGRSLTAVGDINGDGCDDVAAGAPFEDPTTNNEGGIRVLFGFGGSGCPDQPRMVALRSDLNNAQAGYALAGGVDLTGDGVPDLAVGLPNYDDRGERRGAVAIISGAAIAALPREAVQDATPPTYRTLPFTDDTLIVGDRAGELFGRAVAMYRGPGGTDAYVAVGAPNGNEGGANLSGGFRVFRFAPTGFVRPEAAAFGGETSRQGSLLGTWLQAGVLNGRPQIVVGGYQGSGRGLDTGSAYVLDGQF